MTDDHTPAPPGSIVITPKEFYDGVRDDIAAIRQAVSPLPDLKLTVNEHDTRIRSLEQFKWLIVGAAAAAGGSAGALVARLLTST